MELIPCMSNDFVTRECIQPDEVFVILVFFGIILIICAIRMLIKAFMGENDG